ncbi:hypothetical protein ACRYCC_32935 [Actinomadura scrupuli]|uniref:hypothetical protein n=1 Tax=Actinomadura scrupuli TaxID=559629 RepID=UPI003D957433
MGIKLTHRPGQSGALTAVDRQGEHLGPPAGRVAAERVVTGNEQTSAFTFRTRPDPRATAVW